MEGFIILVLIIIVILLFRISTLQKDIARNADDNYDSLKQELKAIQKSIISADKETAPVKPQPLDETVVQFRPARQPEPVKVTAPEPTAAPVTEKEIKEEKTIPVEEEQKPIVIRQPSRPVYTPPPAEDSWWTKWLDKNPDLEKFIGENLINKIGITVLVLGIAFFVKYAIDQNWIKEAGRVAIGIGCGTLLTGLAHYLRNSYRSFSSVLAGGGIAVFYFTIAFGFHEYHLFSQTVAFVVMVIITAFAVALSILYNKLELAVIATIGGFITPFLVSTGSGNYVVLFTYLLILNAGMLALSYFKKWQSITVISFVFTFFIYGGWLIQNTLSANFLFYKNGLLFASAFYLLFLGMTVVYNIRQRLTFKAFDFSMLLVITFGYYAAGLTCLQFWNAGAYQGLFTIALGFINICIAGYFFKTNKGDKNLLFLFIGLALTFLSLTAPIQLHGHSITLFWSAEFVLLYWLSQKSGIVVFKYSSAIIMAAMLLSLMMDWGIADQSSGGEHLRLVYKNLQGIVTNIVAIIAFVLYAFLLKKDDASKNYVLGISSSQMIKAALGIAAIIFYFTCLFGVNLYFYNNELSDVANTWQQLVTFVIVTTCILLINKYQAQAKPVGQLIMAGAAVCFYLLSIPSVISLREAVLINKYPAIHLFIHWLAAAFIAYIIYLSVRLYQKHKAVFTSVENFTVWLISALLISFFSVECMHGYVYVTAQFQPVVVSLQQYSKAGITIVWALCSFTIMWLGMKHKYKTLRIISLFLFSLALLKLFLFDIRNISEGGKIAAFIMLGVLLLIISFMYQKLKKIIIDDNNA